MNSIEGILNQSHDLESKLGYVFKNRTLLALAFVHRSFINENKEITQHNERLEFLGDSVLGLIVSEYLYTSKPSTPEGELSLLRSRLVDASTCVAYMQQLNIDNYLLLGKGEKRGDGRGRDTILSDLFEAIMGAIFLDGGIEAAKHFFFAHFTIQVESILAAPDHNWKALLQDHCQKIYQKPPTYTVISETGPDHSKLFKVIVSINDQVLGQGEGGAKKIAQQAAAKNAWSNLTSQGLADGD